MRNNFGALRRAFVRPATGLLARLRRFGPSPSGCPVCTPAHHGHRPPGALLQFRRLRGNKNDLGCKSVNAVLDCAETETRAALAPWMPGSEEAEQSAEPAAPGGEPSLQQANAEAFDELKANMAGRHLQ